MFSHVLNNICRDQGQIKLEVVPLIFIFAKFFKNLLLMEILQFPYDSPNNKNPEKTDRWEYNVVVRAWSENNVKQCRFW